MRNVHGPACGAFDNEFAPLCLNAGAAAPSRQPVYVSVLYMTCDLRWNYVSAGTVRGAKFVSVQRGLEYFFADVAGATQHRACASDSGTRVGRCLTKSEKIPLPSLCHFGTARKTH